MKALLLVLMATAAVSCSKQAPIDTAKPVVAEAKPLSVSNWGPQVTTAGTAVNALPDGQIGLYFTLSGNIVGEGTRVVFDGTPLDGVVVHDNLITATLPATRFAAAGSKPVVLELGSGQSLEVGNFLVTDPSDSAEPLSPEAAASAPAGETIGATEVVPE